MIIYSCDCGKETWDHVWKEDLIGFEAGCWDLSHRQGTNLARIYLNYIILPLSVPSIPSSIGLAQNSLATRDVLNSSTLIFQANEETWSPHVGSQPCSAVVQTPNTQMTRATLGSSRRTSIPSSTVKAVAAGHRSTIYMHAT